MKKLSLLTFFLMVFFNINGQTDPIKEFDLKAKKYLESLERPKVVINKNLVAYTTHYDEKVNGIKAESVMNTPSFDNPFHIFIKSNKNAGTITIQNKNMTEDMIIDFQYIEKSKKQNRMTSYFFIVNNTNLEAVYITVEGGHNMLFIQYNYDSNNSKTITYVISQI